MNTLFMCVQDATITDIFSLAYSSLAINGCFLGVLVGTM